MPWVMARSFDCISPEVVPKLDNIVALPYLEYALNYLVSQLQLIYRTIREEITMSDENNTGF